MPKHFNKNIMKRNFLKTLMLLCFASMSSAGASAQTGAVKLSFTRTGTSASGVTIRMTDATGTDIAGATATLDASHTFKTGGNVTENIICPDVNGNASPNIQLTFTISGLPDGFEFNEAKMDIHALNGSGTYQQNSDGKARKWNVNVAQGSSASSLKNFAALTDIDIAAGVGESNAVYKEWTATANHMVAASDPMVVRLTITKGSANEGCFFGLSSLTLSKDGTVAPDPEPEPEPKPEPIGSLAGKIFHIIWKANTTSYMTEEADGSLVVAEPDITRRQYWQFVGTDKEDVYYLRNTATGRYIASCNNTPSSASKISTTTTPVEYYVKQTTATAAEIKNCYWFSSTDCADYDDENAGPCALNKDGASSSVITWQAGHSRVGSYWKIVETENLYELRPFQVSEAQGKPTFEYVVSSHLSGKVLQMDADGTLSWQDKDNSAAQTWYFVGENNKNGYQMINSARHETLKDAQTDTDRWSVLSGETDAPTYFFRPTVKRTEEGTAFAVAGDSLLLFRLQRSAFARANQIYEMPCGAQTSHYLAQASISGSGALVPMLYPLPVKSVTAVSQPSASRPTSWYTLYTQDKATVVSGETFTLTLKLNSKPLEGMTAFVYFDWDRDGVFETAQELTLATSMEEEISVPATAKEGKLRMRFRLTDNALTDAEDEVTGQIVDFVLNVVSSKPETYVCTAVSCDENRGTVTLTEEGDAKYKAAAKTKGNATFVCWREGNRIVSVRANYAFTLDHNTHLTAYFSPNTDPTDVGIDRAETVSDNVLIDIAADRRTVHVNTAANVRKLQIFSPDGALLAETSGTTLDISAVNPGAYIVRVVTDVRDAAAKVLVK